jgi:ParB family chromosome partitioning protein
MDRKLMPRKVSPMSEFFKQDEPVKEHQDSGVGPVMLKVVQCVPFADHPFKLYEGKRLEDFAEDIKDNGVIQPIIVRPKEGQIEVNGVMLPLFEILCGHNRWNGSKIAGLEDIPAFIKEGLNDAEAKIFVVNSNFNQRSMTDMLPSELAKAYKMQLDAYKETGKKQEFLQEIQEASKPCGDRDSEGSFQSEMRQWNLEKVADDNETNGTKIHRYIRLNYLIERLLNMVDDGTIGVIPAVSLSFLKEDEQSAVLECMDVNSFKIDVAKANALHSYSKAGSMTSERIYTVLSGAKKKPGRPTPIKVNPKVISRFFTQGQTPDEINETIEKALEIYLSERGRT